MIEADIPTGYVVNKQTLRDEERAGPYHIWKRSRFTRQKVYLHIDYVSHQTMKVKWCQEQLCRVVPTAQIMKSSKYI